MLGGGFGASSLRLGRGLPRGGVLGLCWCGGWFVGGLGGVGAYRRGSVAPLALVLGSTGRSERRFMLLGFKADPLLKKLPILERLLIYGG